MDLPADRFQSIVSDIKLNNGEYVISNIVYGLKQEIHAEHMENLQIFAME